MFRLLTILIFFFTLIYAHPHTFMEVYPSIQTQNNTIKQVDIKWIIDEMTSSMLIMEFDSNGDGKIDKKENNYINKNYFSTLKEFDYYTHTKQKYKVINFKANIKNNKIEYNYSLVFSNKINIKDFSMSFYDTDFFVSMVLKEQFVKQNIPHIVEDIDGDYYFGYKITYK